MHALSQFPMYIFRMVFLSKSSEFHLKNIINYINFAKNLFTRTHSRPGLGFIQPFQKKDYPMVGVGTVGFFDGF